ncbi:hypothetical protein HanIR_Chr02g0094631 [Helianthus annuus]|nr:hypothetical protein HanIR_Chr02g0094631 [Helianthus annuus]
MNSAYVTCFIFCMTTDNRLPIIHFAIVPRLKLLKYISILSQMIRKCICIVMYLF